MTERRKEWILMSKQMKEGRMPVKNREPNLPAHTPPPEQNTLPGLLGAPQSHTRKGLVSVTSRNLLHPYGPKVCFQVIEKFAFSLLYLLPDNTECFCSHRL